MSNTERQIAEQEPSPQQVLMQIPQGMWVAQCVATAARLGIADALAELQPQRSDTLARAVGADASALARLLRALASLGVFAEPLPQQYALNPISEGSKGDSLDRRRSNKYLFRMSFTPVFAMTDHVRVGVRFGHDGMSALSPFYPHVWTAPSWQGLSSPMQIGRCAHVFGLLCGSHDRWP